MSCNLYVHNDPIGGSKYITGTQCNGSEGSYTLTYGQSLCMNNDLPISYECGLTISGECLSTTPTPTPTPNTFCYLTGTEFTTSEFICPFDGNVYYNIYGNLTIVIAINGVPTSSHPPYTFTLINANFQTVTFTIPDGQSSFTYTFPFKIYSIGTPCGSSTGTTCGYVDYDEWFINSAPIIDCGLLPTPTPTITPTITPTKTSTPTVTPSITPYPICPEQIIVDYALGVPTEYEGEYNRLYSYSGGSLAGGYVTYTGVGFYSYQFYPDAYSGNTYAIYGRVSGSTYYTLVFSIGDSTYVDCSGNTVSERYIIFKSTGNYLTNNGTPTFNSSIRVPVAITDGSIYYPGNGRLLFTATCNVLGSYSFAYPAVCPTTTPTPTLTQTPTPTNTETPTNTPTPTNTLTPTITPSATPIPLFVGGGVTTNKIAYSSNGINWTGSTNANTIFTDRVNCILWDGTKWFAGGEGTNTLGYSNLASTWSASINGNSIFSTSVYSIAYDGSLYVAAGFGTNVLGYSNDGINWNASANGNTFFTVSFAVATDGSMWVAGGNSPDYLIYSTDGINWNPTSNGSSIFTTNVNGIAWNGSMWVAAGGGTNTLGYSYDGINWFGSSNGNSIIGSAQSTSVAWNGTKWVVGAKPLGGTNPTNTIAISNDGITWSATTNGNSIFNQNVNSVAWNGTKWVAGGQGVNSLGYSTDGLTWSGSSNGNTFMIIGFGVASKPAPNLYPPR